MDKGSTKLNSETLLQDILDNVEAYIYLKDTAGRYLFVNRLVRQLWQAEMEDIVGFGDEKFFDAPTAKNIRNNDRRVIDRGETVKAEETNTVPVSGETKTYLSIKLPLRREDGSIYALCGISTDITQRIQSEQALKESEARFRDLFEKSPDPCWIINEDNLFMLCNRAAAEILGYGSIEELRATHPSKLSPEVQPDGNDSFEKANVMIAAAYAKGVHRFEWQHRRKNGECFPVEVTLARIEVDGKPQLYCVWRDISERKQAEEELRRRGNEFHNIIDASPVPFALNDSQGNITYLNPAFIHTFGYDLADIPTLKDWWSKAYPDATYRHWVERTWQNHLDTAKQRGETFEAIELDIRCKDGATRIAIVGATLLQENFGGVHLVTLYDVTDRKRAEQRIVEGEERLRLAMEAAGQGWVDLHIPTGRAAVSPEIPHMLGYTEEEYSPSLDTLIETLHPDEKGRVLEELNRCFHETGYGILEYRRRTKGGGWIWVNNVLKVVERDAEGNSVRLIGVHTDITARKQAEASLQLGEERLRLAMDAAHQAWFDLHIPTGEAKVSPEYPALLGFTEDEFDSSLQHWMGSLHPDDKAVVMETFQRCLETSGPEIMEYRRRTKSGDWKWMYSVGKIIERDAQGQPVRMVGIQMDITERKQAEAAMDASRERFQTLFDSSADALMIHDLEGRILEANRTICERYGYSRDELLAMQVGDIVSPRFVGQVPLRLETISRQGQMMFESEHCTRNGKTIPVELSARRIELDGEPVIFSIARDISERKMFEEQLRQSQKMEAVGTLVGGIAHDFNNMLAAIQGNVHLARMHLSDNPKASEKLNNIDQLGKRAAEMVQQLLTFARKGTVEMSVFNLNDFIKEALKLTSSIIPENIGHQIEFCDEPLNIRGDITQMQQVLMNLLGNAVDALVDVERPAIRISLLHFRADEAFKRRHPELAGDGYARLTVRDNGCGIGGDMLDKIFEPFFTTKEVGKGTGLGLAMVYGALQTHGGAVEVKSRLGKGTDVHLFLPLIPGSNADSADTRLATQAAQGQGEMILLVDDEQQLRGTTAEVLQLLGYRVVEAADGARALEVFHKHRENIALVISDVIMPVMGGVDLLGELRRIDGEIPVILMTGYDKQHVLDGDLPPGQCEVISKPFDFYELSSIIQELIDVRRG